MLSFHKLDQIPDHVVQEMEDFTVKLCSSMQSCIDTVEPNIALCGLNWSFACMIKYLVKNDPEELRKAVKMCSTALLNNMEALIKIMENEGKDI